MRIRIIIDDYKSSYIESIDEAIEYLQNFKQQKVVESSYFLMKHKTILYCTVYNIEFNNKLMTEVYDKLLNNYSIHEYLSALYKSSTKANQVMLINSNINTPRNPNDFTNTL